MAKIKITNLTTDEIEKELKRVKYVERNRGVLKNTIYVLLIVAAAAVLVATLFLPVLQIYGNSMTPTLHDGQLIVSVKDSEFEHGDIIAFYYNNKILVKRVIASSGDWVNIDKNGIVAVNGKVIEEPYIAENALGECNIDLPYQVPEGGLFVMGDHRSVSIDSRHSSVGCITQEQVVGKLVMCIWPLKELKILD